MHGGGSQVELMQELSFVLHDKTDRLSGSDLEALRLEIIVAHHNLDGSACSGRFAGLAEGQGRGVSVARSGLFTGMSSRMGASGQYRPGNGQCGGGDSCNKERSEERAVGKECVST